MRITHFGLSVKAQYAPDMRKHISQKDRKKLHSLLRTIRLKAGLTQVELAGKLGRMQSYVSKYELGERRLDVLELRELCLAVGISTTDFVERLEEALS